MNRTRRGGASALPWPWRLNQATDGRWETMETCDRCGSAVKAAFTVVTANGPVLLCAHCLSVHAEFITAHNYPVSWIPQPGDTVPLFADGIV